MQRNYIIFKKYGGYVKLVGIGTDIIEIRRIEKALEREGFKEKVFTKLELEELKNKRIESYAGKFSAKEAVSKALGTGVRGFSLLDIEILNNKLGKPEAYFKKEMENSIRIEISISHCKEYATATAIVYK